MNNTLAVKFVLTPNVPWTEIIIAQLSDLQFDAFEENESGFIAYGNENLIQKEDILNISSLKDESLDFNIEFETIPYQNWNETWESDFQPVFVEDDLAILAPFHDRKLEKRITIDILPKMSFGTGHHQTTWMMSKAILDEEFIPETVLDMGTGTGVLAILVEKLGAKKILAIDIEEWSVENTVENAERNKCKFIESKLGDVNLIEHDKFDLILANINKNVLKKHLISYISALNKNGKLMISGFFDSDCLEMIDFSTNLGLTFVNKQTKETWAQLTFKK